MNIAQLVKKYAPTVIAGFTAIIFLDSLRYKFTDHPNTQEIFGRLDQWAALLGAPGLFAHNGLFSQFVIGMGELAASALLLIGIVPKFVRLQAIGSLIAVAVLSGAISFHLFTPLGVDPNNDGGGLFMAAVMVWVLSVIMLIIRRRELMELFGGIKRAFLPDNNTVPA